MQSRGVKNLFLSLILNNSLGIRKVILDFPEFGKGDKYTTYEEVVIKYGEENLKTR
jgi:hypothetical protein